MIRWLRQARAARMMRRQLRAAGFYRTDEAVFSWQEVWTDGCGRRIVLTLLDQRGYVEAEVALTHGRGIHFVYDDPAGLRRLLAA